jgi:hypothetical protein
MDSVDQVNGVSDKSKAWQKSLKAHASLVTGLAAGALIAFVISFFSLAVWVVFAVGLVATLLVTGLTLRQLLKEPVRDSETQCSTAGQSGSSPCANCGSAGSGGCQQRIEAELAARIDAWDREHAAEMAYRLRLTPAVPIVVGLAAVISFAVSGTRAELVALIMSVAWFFADLTLLAKLRGGGMVRE